jgi:hypothetical protein
MAKFHSAAENCHISEFLSNVMYMFHITLHYSAYQWRAGKGSGGGGARPPQLTILGGAQKWKRGADSAEFWKWVGKNAFEKI